MPLPEPPAAAASPATRAARAAHELAPGATLDGRYVIEEELGRGGMARVFAARDEKLGREVAIKVVEADDPEPAQLERLTREARTAGSLAHPNIVAIHDVGTHDGRPYLVEERLRGETLRRRLRLGAVPPERAIDLAIQLSRGLAAAHAQGIVHRDVKPDNLFVTDDGALKILDFGIATLRPASAGPHTWTTGSGAMAGTPGYMSPEQIHGSAVDARSDLFGFGLVLYELLAGRPAFERETPFELAWAILNEPPAPLPQSVPGPLRRIVLRCLEKEPAARFQSTRDLTFDLEALQAGAPRPDRFSRRIAALAGAGLLLSLAAIAALLVLRRTTPPIAFRQLTFHRGGVWSARFAPDGKTIYYAVTAGAPEPQLYSTTVDRPESRKLEAPPANLLAVSATGELAILLRPRITRGGFDRGTLATLVPNGGAPRELAEEVEAADWAPAGGGLLIVRTVASRARLEFPIGHVVYESDGWIGSPRFSPDGKRIAFLSHPNPADQMGQVMVCGLDGAARAVDGHWRSVEGLAWARGGSEVWFTAAPPDAPAGHSALHAADLSGHTRVLTQAAGDLQLEDVAADGRALVTEPDRRLGLAVVGAGDEKPRDLSLYDRAFLGDLSADGRAVLFTVEGPAAASSAVAYLRRTDESAPVRLGDGYGAALSPDGRWALLLSLAGGKEQPLSLVPTGAGEPKRLDARGITATRAIWFPDGERLLVAGVEAGRGARLFVRDVRGGPVRPITGEGVSGSSLGLSRDGATAVALDAQRRATLYPVDGGEPAPISGIDADESVFGFADDGSLFVGRPRPLSVAIDRLDLRTHRRAPVRTLLADAPGALGIFRVQVTPDARAFAFNYGSMTTHLYLMSSTQ